MSKGAETQQVLPLGHCCLEGWPGWAEGLVAAVPPGVPGPATSCWATGREGQGFSCVE